VFAITYSINSLRKTKDNINMAASVSGSKIPANNITPHFTAAYMATLFAIAPENMTVAQVKDLHNALQFLAGGNDPTKVVGALVA
jgi:hypothetical protein